jgi:hypothetical protein
MLDKDLEVAIYDVFINNQILIHRDSGGFHFTKLTNAIKEKFPNAEKHHYIQIARKLRKKLGIEDTKGYNEKEHNAEIQRKRDELEKHLILIIKSGLINSCDELCGLVEKIDISEL